MSTPAIVVAFCLVYLAINLAVGLLAGRRVSASVDGFVAGDRNMSTPLLYFVLGASVFSSFAFLGAPGWAYSRGAAAFYIIAFGTLGMVPYYFYGPKLRRVGAQHGFVTQAQMLGWRFESSTLQVLLALASVVVFVPYLTLQMKGAGLILETVSDGAIPYWAGAALTYGVVCIYVMVSGLMAVGWTNALQGVFMMIVAWGLGLYLPWKLYGGVGEMFAAIDDSVHAGMLAPPGLTGGGEPWDWWGYSSFVLVSAAGISCWPHLFMKGFAARNERTVRLTVVMYPTFQIFLVPILLMGFAAILAFPGVTPADRIIPHILRNLEFSPWLIGVVSAAALAASMSTGDSILHSAASVAIRDGVRPWHNLGDSMERVLMRLMVLIIGGVSFAFALSTKVSIVGLLAGAYGGVAQLLPVVLAAFYWSGATRAGVLSGFVGGCLVSIFFLLWPDLRPWPAHEGLYGLVANVTLLLLVSRFTARPGPERISDFLRV